MPGAYVAKPAESTALVPGEDIPLGWNPDWTFPGPWPPGYEPELTYDLSAENTYTPGESHATSATLFDHVTFKTLEPANEYILSATLDGSPIVLKKTGGAAAAANLILSHDELDDSFWGASVNLEFGVGEDDDEKTINLTIKSHPWDDIKEAVEDSIEITVEVGTVQYAVFTVEMDGYKGQWLEEWNVDPYIGDRRRLSSSFGMEVYFGNNAGYTYQPYGTTSLQHSNTHEAQPPNPHWIFYHASSSVADYEITCPEGELGGHGCDYPRIIGESAEGTTVIKAVQIRPYASLPWVPLTYEVKYKHFTSWVGPGNTSTFKLTFQTFDINDNVMDTWTKDTEREYEEGGDDDWVVWLTLDGTSKEVTVVNP